MRRALFAAAGVRSIVSVMSRPVALVTGSTDGIGRLTSALLARDDFTVLLHGRSQSRLGETREEILSQTPHAHLETYCYDLQTKNSVLALAADVLSKHGKHLDVVVQNAGVFMQERVVTADNLEMTFAVNVCAPFLLAQQLLPVLSSTAGSRMLMVSSISQSDGGGRYDMSKFEHESWDSYSSYGQSKLQMAMLSHQLSTKFTNPVIMSCDPGTVNTKMLLAGWGRCGIPISSATDEYELVKGPADATKHGKYFVGLRESRCSSSVYDATARAALWSHLEETTAP